MFAETVVSLNDSLSSVYADCSESDYLLIPGADERVLLTVPHPEELGARKMVEYRATVKQYPALLSQVERSEVDCNRLSGRETGYWSRLQDMTWSSGQTQLMMAFHNQELRNSRKRIEIGTARGWSWPDDWQNHLRDSFLDAGFSRYDIGIDNVFAARKVGNVVNSFASWRHGICGLQFEISGCIDRSDEDRERFHVALNYLEGRFFELYTSLPPFGPRDLDMHLEEYGRWLHNREISHSRDL